MRKVLLLFFVLALVGSACSSGSKTVATVNGYEISLSDVQALAPSDGTVDTTTFDRNLQNLIIEKAAEQAAALRHHREAAVSDIIQALLRK